VHICIRKKASNERCHTCARVGPLLLQQRRWERQGGKRKERMEGEREGGRREGARREATREARKRERQATWQCGHQGAYISIIM